jgi:hypothetical protein
MRGAAPSLRSLVGSVLALLVSACAHQPAPPVPPDAIHPRSVAIVPVLPSESLTIDRRALIGGVIERLIRLEMQRQFSQQFERDRAAVADALTASMLAAARRRGFDATVLTDIARNPKDPDDFDDYTRIATDADVIVHVHLRDVGVFNPFSSLDYEPSVDTRVHLIARRSGYEMLDENFHYGVNATKQAFWAVPSDPVDRWPDWLTVQASGDAIERSWKKGADALGARIIEQLPAPSAH